MPWPYDWARVWLPDMWMALGVDWLSMLWKRFRGLRDRPALMWLFLDWLK